MTGEEAAKIGRVLAMADGGCYVCVGNLASEMAQMFPEHNWMALVAEAGGWTVEQLEGRHLD